MNTAQIEALLLDEIVSACPELADFEIRTDASLTGELGLDSLTLSALFAGVKAQFGHLQLAPWFIKASNEGNDTIASLAAFISARIARAA